jgi:hypothetical protein
MSRSRRPDGETPVGETTMSTPSLSTPRLLYLKGQTPMTANDPHDSRLTTPDSPAGRRRAAKAAFRARLESGDYRELFGGRLGEVMAQAAEEAGVVTELGTLRIVMARLMEEEDDLEVLAGLVARVASVSIQAARIQRAITGQLAESLTDAVTTILADLEGSDG